MKTYWMIAFALNLCGAGLCLYSGNALQNWGLIALGSINVVYAVYSLHRLGQLNEL